MSNSMRKRKYKINEEFLDIIDTPEKAYFLGWAYSDGYHNEECYSFRLALQARDEDILVKLNSILESECPIKFIKRRKEHHQDQKYLNFHSKKLSKSLSNLGVVQGKSKTLTIPLEKIPERYIKYLLRGWFEGDGHLSFGKRKDGVFVSFNIPTASYNCAEQLKQLIEKGSGQEIKIYNCEKYSRLVFVSKRNIYRFMMWLYSEREDLALNRKLVTTKAFLNFYKNIYNKGFDRHPKQTSHQEREEILALREQGKCSKEISERTGRSPSVVINFLKKQKDYKSFVKKYSVDLDIFDLKKITNESVFTLGYLISKANINQETNNVSICDANLSKLLFIKSLLKCDRPIRKTTNTNILNFSGKALVELMRNCGFSLMIKDHNFPFESLSQEHKVFFILGLLEARGFIYKRKDRNEITLSLPIPQGSLSERVCQFIENETKIPILARKRKESFELRKSGLKKPIAILEFLFQNINLDLSILNKFKEVKATLL